jgi:hypothetical protein
MDFGHFQQLTAEGEFFLAVTVGEEAIVANALKTIREEMEQKSANELIGGQRYRFQPIIVAVILPVESDLGIFDIEDAVVGDGHTVSGAANIVENLSRAGKRGLGIDDQFASLQGSQIAAKLVRVAKCGTVKTT